MAPTDPSTRRPKRKRSRKARTAISSSEESASEAEKPTVIQPASVHSDSASDDDDYDDAAPSTMEAESDFDQEYPDTAALDIHDDEGVDDALQPPSLLLPRSGPTDVSTPSKTMMHARLTSMTDAQISQELTEKQRDAFHALYMQALTDEFGDELDEIRQNDPLLGEDTNTSQATARMPLLIDALSFGTEVFTSGRDASAGGLDQVALALPS